jgi:hypothetical protein
MSSDQSFAVRLPPTAIQVSTIVIAFLIAFFESFRQAQFGVVHRIIWDGIIPWGRQSTDALLADAQQPKHATTDLTLGGMSVESARRVTKLMVSDNEE